MKSINEIHCGKTMKVLFLSSDTGGGHRASAESLANQLMINFPGSCYDIIDIWVEGKWPYNKIVISYKHLSAHPGRWRLLYHTTNRTPVRKMLDWHSTATGKTRICEIIERYNPDAIISVHPLMQHVPLKSRREVYERTGKYIPFFTVVTDLASAHGTWFSKDVDKVFVASQELFDIAEKSSIPKEKIVMSGLPIRHGFAIQANRLGNRNSLEGRVYQEKMKYDLGMDKTKPMILVMGGGEGVGGLSSIVTNLYSSLKLDGINATICVVCGRNEKVRAELMKRDWKNNILPKTMWRKEKKDDNESCHLPANENSHKLNAVDIICLGFIEEMAEYMVAADVLVSKAGPGTIAEAAAVGLPVLLTSFLPGQEAGNVDFVLENGFGQYENDPVRIGQTISNMLKKGSHCLQIMSAMALVAGSPNAAAEIIRNIANTRERLLDKGMM